MFVVEFDNNGTLLGTGECQSCKYSHNGYSCVPCPQGLVPSRNGPCKCPGEQYRVYDSCVRRSSITNYPNITQEYSDNGFIQKHAYPALLACLVS